MKLFRNFTSQEEIDREYDLALTVPDVEYWIERPTQESVTDRRKPDCMLDVRFGPTVDETVDIFPAKEQGAPLMDAFLREDESRDPADHFRWVTETIGVRKRVLRKVILLPLENFQER